jgi:hypothetical protein
MSDVQPHHAVPAELRAFVGTWRAEDAWQSALGGTCGERRAHSLPAVSPLPCCYTQMIVSRTGNCGSVAPRNFKTYAAESDDRLWG